MAPPSPLSRILPRIGATVRYMLQTHGGGLVVRPAIVHRVGPARVGQADTGQLGLSVFPDPTDCFPPVWQVEAWEAPQDEFKAGTWRWVVDDNG
jgi:hypothetical protein